MKFGSSSRDQANRLFISSEHEKCQVCLRDCEQGAVKQGACFSLHWLAAVQQCRYRTEGTCRAAMAGLSCVQIQHVCRSVPCLSMHQVGVDSPGPTYSIPTAMGKQQLSTKKSAGAFVMPRGQRFVDGDMREAAQKVGAESKGLERWWGEALSSSLTGHRLLKAAGGWWLQSASFLWWPVVKAWHQLTASECSPFCTTLLQPGAGAYNVPSTIGVQVGDTAAAVR